VARQFITALGGTNTTGSTTGSSNVVLDGGVLRGADFIIGGVFAHSGATVTGGVFPAGTLTLGDAMFDPGSTLLFSLTDAQGAAGAPAG